MSTHRTLKSNLQQVLGLDGKLHGELVHHLLGISVDNQGDGLLGGNTSLIAVEELVLGDFRCRGLMLHYGGIIEDIYIGEGVGTAVAAHEQRVTLGVIAASGGIGSHFHQSTIGILGMSGRDTLRHDGRG